ncbi:DEAD/DEAH box helicase family protein [Candidatus Poriferisodalis sp.]|uniref:DEAD/DEAH box helicase family protein n=1 Tax=Candidatus Poriferisodalis sp. TaxID=3101277 RepID=UPI003B01A1AB
MTRRGGPSEADERARALWRARAVLDEHGPQHTDGTWLEELTVEIGPRLADWDVEVVYPWAQWPERLQHFPHSTEQDTGIDSVAVRRSDGEHIAVQCKSRQLDAEGRGNDIHKSEFDSFASASSSAFWSERWLVTNGSVQLSGPAEQNNQSADAPVKLVNLRADVTNALSAASDDTECEHCAAQSPADALPRAPSGGASDIGGTPATPAPRQTRSCMQREAIEASVRLLREHAETDTGGLPVGQARGRIVLPCGTGKTRIALRITEQLTDPGELSVVLCPSIALVAQIRREFLNHATAPMRALAVCSDATAGYDPKREDRASLDDDPTLDTSNVSAHDVKGQVTTDADEIAAWIRHGAGGSSVNVIFGTYQSAGRVAAAISAAGAELQLLVCDEAHRTASLRRKRRAAADADAKLREFTLCHDQAAFPARYRVYQTATPRIYNHTTSTQYVSPSEFIVRSMDDETTFGVELYRRSYMDAVANGWLADYRIIALGVSDQHAYDLATNLARDAAGTGRHKLTTIDHVRGLALALALAGGTRTDDERSVAVNSCIAFMNTVNKSKHLAENLQTDAVRDWLTHRLDGRAPAPYTLEHLDASSNVTARDNAKRRLAEATGDAPHGIVNVGIFGEGTDSPSLNAVAFLEPRRSPIDVVQAVGRAMRTSPDKALGYVICPILIPPAADAEQWLSTARPEEGWNELGQILLALRAHDERIENELAGLLRIHLPPAAETPRVFSLVAVPSRSTGRIRYGEHIGPPDSVFDDVEAAAAGDAPLSDHGISRLEPERWAPDAAPTLVVAAIPPHDGDADGTVRLRQDSVERDKPKAGEPRGAVNAEKTKKLARKMVNQGAGKPVPTRAERAERKRRRAQERHEVEAQRMLNLVDSAVGAEITVNLLANSGLQRDRTERDLNILESSVSEAAHHLRTDELQAALDAHFGLDQLAADKRKSQADGCTIAALLMMNAAMLHQRIASGAWLRGVEPLALVKNDPRVVERLKQNWQRITRQDFLPVIEPAQEVVFAAERTGRLAGLERAVRHLAAEAERIAATYADMGADHAGPLFNKVMGNQASDGAFFTRPPAATIAARLALDACSRTGRGAGGTDSTDTSGNGNIGETGAIVRGRGGGSDGTGDSAGRIAGDAERVPADWSDPRTWLEHRAVDLACGSGTLLAALLTEMKRRAAADGATDEQLAELQRLAVEEVLTGMDINPVSLQLAATQLTAGNANVSYRRMGLYQMPYGPTADSMVPTAAGTLELLAEEAVLPAAEAQMFAAAAKGTALSMNLDTPASLKDPNVRSAAEAAMRSRIAIMNPPYTERERMGQKFPESIQVQLRQRVDGLERALVAADAGLAGFVSKRALEPMFTALAEHCVETARGVQVMIQPTVALSAPSSWIKRQVLAQRFDLDTVLTCHQPGNINLSQNTSINESIVVLRRRADIPGADARGGKAGTGRQHRADAVTPPPARLAGASARCTASAVHQSRPATCRRLRGRSTVRGHRPAGFGRVGRAGGRLGRGVALARGARATRRLDSRSMALARIGGRCGVPRCGPDAATLR